MSSFMRNRLPLDPSSASILAAQPNGAATRAIEILTQRMCPPARMSASQAADALGFHVDDIPTLVRAGLLTPLGKPINNAVKYFSSEDIANLGCNRQKLDKAQEFLYERNQKKVTASSD